VISDVFYPGWELFVNGSKQKIYKANTTFRAGVLKAGVNNILFNYNPKSFKIGYLFSILGIALTIGLLIIHFRVTKQKAAKGLVKSLNGPDEIRPAPMEPSDGG
jgi:uncharacterized membrane protein YfhO